MCVLQPGGEQLKSGCSFTAAGPAEGRLAAGRHTSLSAGQAPSYDAQKPEAAISTRDKLW